MEFNKKNYIYIYIYQIYNFPWCKSNHLIEGNAFINPITSFIHLFIF